MVVDRPANTISFIKRPRSDSTFKTTDDSNVVYVNLRSVLIFMGGITVIIVLSVALFNVVASRFATPGSMEVDSPAHAPLSDPMALPHVAPVSVAAPPSRAPAATYRKKGSAKRGGVAERPKKHKKRRHSRRRSPHANGKEEGDASEAELGAMRARQDAPDSTFVNNYDSWREIADEGNGERRRRSECGRPQCRWLSRYLTSKLDWTIKPCHDFYSHVCSAKWFTPSPQQQAAAAESERGDQQDSLDFRTQAVARLMNELAAYLKKKVSTMPWERNAAAFFTDCLKPKTPRTLSSIRPRFPIWPLEKITSVSTLPKLVAYVARFFRATPLLQTYVGDLRSTLRNDTLYVDSPVLPLAR